MLLDKLESMVASYDMWNDAIFSFFFSLEKSQRDIRLSFDDSALAAVSASLDSVPESFLESVAALVNPEASEPFAKFLALAKRERNAPSTIGLLAAQVLIASRMHADRDYSSHAFWPRFNQMLLRRCYLNPPRDCEMFSRFWRDLQKYLNVTNEGLFGLLRLTENPSETPIRNWRHVNYPLSQCLVREVDRADLAEFFLENPLARDCADNQLITLLDQSQYAFGKSFAATLRQAIENPTFASELTRIIAEIRTQVMRQALVTSGCSNASQRRIRTRLKLTTVRGEIVLELQQLLDDWRRRVFLDAEEWENGVSDERSYALWSGASYTLFVEGGDGFVTTREPLRDGTRVRLLLSGTQFDKFQDALTQADAAEMLLSERLAGIRCFQFRVNELRDELLMRLMEASSGSRLTARLEGGLEIGNSRFAYGAVPRILVLNAAGSRVTINGSICDLNDRGFVISDCTPREPGDYEIVIADVRLRYSVVDLDTGEDSCDGGYIGYLLSASEGLMQTEDLSLCSQSVANASILVGAELQ